MSALAKYLAKKGKSPKMKLNKKLTDVVVEDAYSDKENYTDEPTPKNKKSSEKKRPAYLD